MKTTETGIKQNKTRVAALQRCKYSNGPEYKQWCQQYQALYAQNNVMQHRMGGMLVDLGSTTLLLLSCPMVINYYVKQYNI